MGCGILHRDTVWCKVNIGLTAIVGLEPLLVEMREQDLLGQGQGSVYGGLDFIDLGGIVQRISFESYRGRT